MVDYALQLFGGSRFRIKIERKKGIVELLKIINKNSGTEDCDQKV